MQNQTIYPVIMCGGSGTRLWPLSVKAKPKQYHPLVSDKTMLQETILHISTSKNLKIARPSFVCSIDHENIVYEQAKQLGIDPLNVILEPMGRNTAAVAAIVSELIGAQEPNGIILLLPADHHIKDIEEFWRCIAFGLVPASQGKLVTLGIQPTSPATGYGYIKKGPSLSQSVYEVARFVEKPNLETAQSYIATSDYFWNAGIFLFSPKAMIDSFKAYAPEILNVCKHTIDNSIIKDNSLYLDMDSFSACPSISLDYAIMERANNIVLVAPVNIGWNDIGSWNALDEFAKANEKNFSSKNESNVECGQTLLLECKNTFAHSDGPLIAGIGLENLTIIATKDSVLVLPKSRDQDVKKIVEALKAKDLHKFL